MTSNQSSRRQMVAAARSNAAWCDLVCRTHGLVTTFRADAWTTASRSPDGYPDAVTLTESATADVLLTRVDRSAGCSIKDSFATLDLSDHGFEVLFQAEWIYRPPTAHASRGGLRWVPVRTPAGLAEWAAAHGGGAVFRPALIDDPALVVLAGTDTAGNLLAGAIGNRNDAAVGLSNVFTTSADLDEVWTGATAALTATFPGLPLVGYEHGAHLAAAHAAGFISTGPVRVWLRGHLTVR